MLGDRLQRLSRTGMAAVLAAAAAVLAAGGLVGYPSGVVLIGIAFGAFQATEIVAGTRLQDAISGPARSTVTSVAGFGTEVATIGVYVAYGVAATGTGHGAIFAGFAAAYALLALAVARR